MMRGRPGGEGGAVPRHEPLPAQEAPEPPPGVGTSWGWGVRQADVPHKAANAAAGAVAFPPVPENPAPCLVLLFSCALPAALGGQGHPPLAGYRQETEAREGRPLTQVGRPRQVQARVVGPVARIGHTGA